MTKNTPLRPIPVYGQYDIHKLNRSSNSKNDPPENLASQETQNTNDRREEFHVSIFLCGKKLTTDLAWN